MTTTLKPPFTREDILTIFHELDQKTGLNATEVPIRLSRRMTRSLAYYRYNPATHRSVEFTFSERLLQYASYEQFRETIIHEYTHFYEVQLFGESHHNERFKQHCQYLGGIGDYYQTERLAYLPTEQTEARYTVECTSCHEQFHYHRQTKLIKLLKAEAPHSFYCPYCDCGDLTLKTH